MDGRDWQVTAREIAGRFAGLTIWITGGEESGLLLTVADKANPGLSFAQVAYRMRRLYKALVHVGLDCDKPQTWGRRWTQPTIGGQMSVYGWNDRLRISADDLERLATLNSPELPQAVERAGRRLEWTGLGWIDVGAPKGTEAIVTDSTHDAGRISGP